MTEILRVTQKIDVIEENWESMEREVFFSRIEDIGEESIFITPPFRKGFYLPPRPGRIISARVVSDKVPYLFSATLLRYRSEPLPLWEMSKPSSFRKAQLREDVRLEISLPISLEILNDEPETKVIRTLTRDISAGGVQVVLVKPLPVGTKVGISVAIGDDFVLEMQGKVVRLNPPLPPLDKYFAGIKFNEMDETTKKKVIRYIFGKQAELRMKEKEWFE